MPALSLQNLGKTYENGFTALHDINLDVQEGDFFALLGPNGAGKSTTLGIISTLVRKTRGKVHVFDADLDSEPLRAKTLLGIVPQEFNFNSFETVEQTLLQQGPYYGLSYRESKKRSDKYLSLLELKPKAQNRIMDLSGGQKRRVMIARALIHEPKLLFLDEPSAGVDIEIRRSMWAWLRELNQAGTSIVLTTHYLEEAQNLCRNIAIIDHGKIIANTDMRGLLRGLEQNTFLFEAKAQVSNADMAKLAQSGYAFKRKDAHSFSLEIHQEQNFNHILSQILKLDIELLNIQPEANQLETLFVKLTSRPQLKA